MYMHRTGHKIGIESGDKLKGIGLQQTHCAVGRVDVPVIAEGTILAIAEYQFVHLPYRNSGNKLVKKEAYQTYGVPLEWSSVPAAS